MALDDGHFSAFAAWRLGWPPVVARPGRGEPEVLVRVDVLRGPVEREPLEARLRAALLGIGAAVRILGGGVVLNGDAVALTEVELVVHGAPADVVSAGIERCLREAGWEGRVSVG